MKKLSGAVIGIALMFGAVGCATPAPTNDINQAEIDAERERQRLEAERLRLEAEAQRASEAAERERLAALERARAEEAARLAQIRAERGAPGSVKEFSVVAGERIYFDVDQWRLDDEDKTILARQADWLQTYPSVNILVAGNCDERGTREYNIALGERRAAVVRDYLVSLGIPSSRIEVASNGKDQPWVAGSGPAVWSQNRNGHTQLVSGYTSES